MTTTDNTGRRGAIERAIRRRFGWAPYRALGGAALFGCAAAVLCDVLMWFLVSGYDPLAQTISELGAGPYHDIQDAGIVLFATGVGCLLIGLVLRGEDDGLAAWAERAALGLLAIDIVFIALWNEYGDGDYGGMVIHPYLVAGVYVLVPIIFWLGSVVSPSKNDRFARIGRYAAPIWIFLAPLFYVVPESVNGGYERVLAAVMLSAVALAGFRLYCDPSKV